MADSGEEKVTSTATAVDFDIQLDESEFENDLPTVGVQTLESILNESEDQESVLDEDNTSVPSMQLFRDSGDTSSLSSSDSLLSDKPRKREKKRKGIHYSIHGSVLKPSRLKSVSAQLISAADRVDAGMPTCMAVSMLIAVGTSHGLVLVFDPKQVLKWCLGSTAVGSQFGSVSALSFNKDCTRLLCGFAKGQITMWDLTSGKLLRTISDAHPPGTAVLHIKFTDSLVLAVCSDSGGSVFELEFKRLIGVRTCESKCLFSGSRGEVCCIEPLHMNVTIKDHPMQDVMVIAMATMSKVLLVTIRPQLKVFFNYPLKGDAATLPLLAWQFVIIQVSEHDRVIDPVLAFARESTIHFYQVVCTNAQDIKCTGLQKMKVPYKLLSIKWMNPRTLVTLDTTEKFHIIDVRSEEELEVIDISDLQMVYNTSFFKSLATGGNVSQALAYAGERACYQTVKSHSGQLFLLGTKSVHVYSLRTWRDRIDVLVKQERYQDALVLALSFYEGRAKAVIGLNGSHKKKKEIVADLMLDLLFDFVDLSMTKLCPAHGKIEELEDYYQTIVPVCVDYCLTLERVDILFGRIYDRFAEDTIAHGTFLECIEPYILSDKLVSIPPVVMKSFVEHYEAKDMLESVEACIVHLEVSSLDIHQVVSLCWAHGLYDAIIYVYNRGMNDFTTPLEELLSTLQAAVETGKQLSDNQIKLGNKLLVYISCCLAGRAYPLGDIAEEFIATVKREVFKCVTSFHSSNTPKDESIYPHLRTLLQFDTREFLNVLALAFEEPEFNTSEGIEERQRVVDILLQVMVKGDGFSPTQVGILFTFLARQMARHENTIVVNRDLFEQVLEFLSNPEDESRHEERQQALIELWHAGGLTQVDEHRLLTLVENAKFYRVCELLYEKRREYGKILTCYLRDYSRKYHSFSYISSILNSQRYSLSEKEEVKKAALSNLKELIITDCKQAAHIVISFLSSNLTSITKNLQSSPELLFEFLQGVMSYRDAVGSAIHQDKQVNLEPETFELFIELMADFKPNEVENFVKMNEGYRIEETLEICRRKKLSRATAYLLEKSGDIFGAFGISLEYLNSKIKTLIEVLSSGSPPKDPQILFGEINIVVMVIVQLCQRNSGTMDEEQRKSLWFPLLEALMSPQRSMKDLEESKEILQDFKDLTHHVLTSMMGYLQLTDILSRIMQDPAYNTGKFGEVRELIIGMLDTYNYEQTLMETCKNLLNHDIHVNLRSLTHAAKRGYAPKGDNCFLCNKSFTTNLDVDSVVVFRCGHSYHTGCLRSVGSLHVVDEETWACYLCSHTKKGQVQSSRFHRSLSNSRDMKVVAPVSKNNIKEHALDSQHLQNVEYIRRSMRTPSRLAILTELSKPTSRSTHGSSSIFHAANFKLRLAAPPFSETT